MFETNAREGRAEQVEIQHRQRALQSLMRRRNKQLRESLDHRIKRAHTSGVGIGLTRAEWASLRKQEIARLRAQLAVLELENAYVRKQLTVWKRAITRAKRLRAAQPELPRKRK